MLKHQIRVSGITVFTISESWLNDSMPDKLLEIEGYETVRQDRTWRDVGTNGTQNPKKGGGLVCYINKGIKYSDLNLKHLNSSSKDLEMMWVKLSLENVRPIVIVTVYRPPQGSYKQCCDLISEAFDRADLKDNSDIFLLGDFNINYKEKTGPGFRELDFMTLGLRQLISTPTRTAFRDGALTESIIDLLFTYSDHINTAKTLNLNISDHLGIVASRKKTPFNVDPNWLWDYMYKIILDNIDAMCPMKSFRVTEFKEIWMTNEAIEAIRDKDRALKKAKRTGREHDWAEARRLRNKVGRDIRNLRADYLKNQQEANREDPKKFWKNIASILPGKKGGQSSIWLKARDKDRDVRPGEAANFINRFFTNIGPELAKQHKAQWECYGLAVQDRVEILSTNIAEIQELCKGIEIMKASGLDKLSARACKDAFLALSEQLCYMFNFSLNGEIFPDKWKIAKVIPLFKGGNREDVSNYRPVFLLPLPGTLLENVVHKRISKFWEDNHFLTDNQGGFRKGFSTISTIADLTDDFFNQINMGNTTLAAFIDLRKAFDTVNLHILKKKLEKSGIRSKVLGWCCNYLSNRYQCTYANGMTLCLLPVTCGVPQGSVLGPLFFLVYVNDVQSALDDCGVKLYADDTVLYQPGVNSAEAEAKLQ